MNLLFCYSSSVFNEVMVEGDIASLAYSEKDYDKKGTSLFGKIFK